MKEEQAHGTSLTANAGEQRGTSGNMLTILREPAVQALHKMELTLTTALAFGLTCSWPVFAAELELKPAFDNPGVKVAAITFLPDWLDEGNSGEINMDANRDSRWCEKQGFSYYSSGKCPAYYIQETCSRDKKYLKCDGVKWCTNNGYNITSCDSNKHTNGQCPNGLGYYQKCLCNAEFKYNSSNCSGNNRAEGQSCSDVDNPTRYNQCNCYPSAAWSNYSYSCTGTETQYDGCGRYYHRCCSDTCSHGSKNYSGSYAGKTECGSSCYYCRDCTSGSTSYSGSYVGSSECGSCYRCSDTCYSGSKSVSCSTNYNSVRVSSTECGTGCYECQYNSDCSVTSKSCDYGCTATNSCGKCTACKPAPRWLHYWVYTKTSEGPEEWQNDRCLEKIDREGQLFTWIVRGTSICKNEYTGEEHKIFVSSRCQAIGKGYPTRAACVAAEPAASANAAYGTYVYTGVCKDPWTTSWGTTSADSGKCTR